MRVVVNAAMSLDGKLASRQREPLEISGPADFDRVDALRAESDAVMVGVGTVLTDDPHLTVDDPERIEARVARGEPPQPARVVADSQARTPPAARICDSATTTYLLVSEDAASDAVAALSEAGVEVITAGAGRVDLAGGMRALENRGLSQLMVEGGGTLIFGLLAEGLVDELSVYIGPRVIGGADAPTLVDGDGFIENFPALDLQEVDRLDDGVLLRWRVTAD